MTVCIASLAADGACIVCIADKALSYDDVVWDSDAVKIIPLGSNGGQKEAVALTSGSDKCISRLLRKIRDFDGYAKSLDRLINFLETQFQECVRELQDIEVFIPKAITREEYVAAISQPEVSDFIREIDEDLKELQKEFNCDLLICGTQQRVLPYILHLRPPGVVTDCTSNGFHAIGIGAERAMSRLLFTDHKRTDGVAHTLFDVFDAKAHAEMSAFVGIDWDACFLSGPRIRPLVPEAKPLLDRIWAKRNRSPFKKTKDPDSLPNPPRKWEMKLREMVAKSLGVAFDENGDLRAF